MWGTTYSILYKSRHNLSSSIFNIFREIDDSLSMFNHHSLLSRINRNETDIVDKHFITVFECAQKVSYFSGGKYDCTAKPLIDLWGFGTTSRRGYIPTKQEIETALNYVGISECRIAEGRIEKKSRLTSFDFSSLAKGYAVDCIARMFTHNGINDYLIEIGGEIFAKGKSPYRKNWKVKVLNFSEEKVEIFLDLENKAIATSGIYLNNFNYKGDTYGHIVDSTTGYPISRNIYSTTSIGNSCMVADSLATACFLMQSQHFNKTATMFSEYELIILTNNNEIITYNDTSTKYRFEK